MPRPRRLMLVLALAAFASCSFRDKSKPASDPSGSSAHEFVAGFYKWYMHKSPSPTALLERPEMTAALAPPLLQALREDRDAQAAGNIAFDADPFLAAQDPCERYDVTTVVKRGDHYRVAVLGSGGCEQHNEPDLFAEVARVDGGWRIVDFWYPRPAGEWDLLSNLRHLRKLRETPAPAASPATDTGSDSA